MSEKPQNNTPPDDCEALQTHRGQHGRRRHMGAEDGMSGFIVKPGEETHRPIFSKGDTVQVWDSGTDRWIDGVVTDRVIDPTESRRRGSGNGIRYIYGVRGLANVDGATKCFQGNWQDTQVRIRPR